MVFFRLGKNKHRKDEAVASILTMRSKIQGLRELYAGTDFMALERSWDLALIAVFDNRQDLEAYDHHPEHTPVKEFLKSLGAESVSVDFEN
ncbi:MAG: Dabb family protein [Spirochaetales bacterium]|nr:Dabb family protein [Spirochaetales bacterium]